MEIFLAILTIVINSFGYIVEGILVVFLLTSLLVSIGYGVANLVGYFQGKEKI